MEQTLEIPSIVRSPSHEIAVLDSTMHYIEEGTGDPILFIHGIPTSSYLWRNIVPELAAYGRCIAVDLIGMGQSGKPDIDYTVFDHIRYLTAFIDALELKNLTLVVHGWGSVIGFAYAAQHAQNLKALSFIESHIRPVVSWEMVSLPVQELTSLMDTPDGGYDVVMNSNYFVNKVLPSGVLRTLSEDEMQHYRAPFTAPGSCKPLWQYLQDLPLGETESPVIQMIADYSQFLIDSRLPKLMMYAIPGFITTVDTVSWARDNLQNLTLTDVGDCLHYPQESNPHCISDALIAWYSQLP